eukprot:1190736-Prorocentrum_minimum.AAC.4
MNTNIQRDENCACNTTQAESIDTLHNLRCIPRRGDFREVYGRDERHQPNTDSREEPPNEKDWIKFCRRDDEVPQQERQASQRNRSTPAKPVRARPTGNCTRHGAYVDQRAKK